MDSKHAAEHITGATCRQLLEQYKDYVPPDLKELDHIRYVTIPEVIQSRRTNDKKGPFLTKSELESLMQWKLKHGTYRPNLAKLISSNTPETVHQVTITAFNAHIANPNNKAEPLKTLTSLRGVGPATASLLLSCLDLANIPFFSDELYRYVLWDDGKGRGWDRKIGYTPKEYIILCDRVERLRERLGKEDGGDVSAGEIEMVAYVLGRSIDKGGEKRRGRPELDQEGEKPRETKRRRDKDEMKEPKGGKVHAAASARTLRSRDSTTTTISGKTASSTST